MELPKKLQILSEFRGREDSTEGSGCTENYPNKWAW